MEFWILMLTEDPTFNRRLSGGISQSTVLGIWFRFAESKLFLGVIYLADADGRPILQSHTLSLLQMFDSVANDDCSSHSLNRMTQEWQRRRAVMI